MKPEIGVDGTKKIITFSLIILLTAGIASLLTAAFLKKSRDYNDVKLDNFNNNTNSSPINYNVLIANNNVLSNRINLLQQLDQKFADKLSESGDKKMLDSINLQIFVQEEVFRGSIDSIFLNSASQRDTNLNNLSNNMVSSYRSILNNRQAITSLRNAINLNSTSLSPDKKVLLKLQNELQQKNNQLLTLENSIKSMGKEKGSVVQKNDIQEGNSSALKKSITDLENKVYLLTSTNYILKQDNEKFLKAQTNAAKTNSSDNDPNLKNKAIALQKNVDMLDAELRLARVDCNLSRVDASQIISNSRQRKELLSEASGILTSLSKYDDAEIKKKVHDKITRLNQVAANSRD